jgi:hypothetical protein
MGTSLTRGCRPSCHHTREHAQGLVVRCISIPPRPRRPTAAVGAPSTCASTAVCLAPDVAACTTGSTLRIDGGKLAGAQPFTQVRAESRMMSQTTSIGLPSIKRATIEVEGVANSFGATLPSPCRSTCGNGSGPGRQRQRFAWLRATCLMSTTRRHGHSLDAAPEQSRSDADPSRPRPAPSRSISPDRFRARSFSFARNESCRSIHPQSNRSGTLT